MAVSFEIGSENNSVLINCGTHRKGVEKMSEKKTVQTICLVAREEDGQVKVRFLLQEANEHMCIRALREVM